jgi:hypothetical protein
VDFIIKPQALKGGGVLLHKLEEAPTEITSPLPFGCSEHLHHADSVKIQSQIPSHDDVF